MRGLFGLKWVFGIWIVYEFVRSVSAVQCSLPKNNQKESKAIKQPLQINIVIKNHEVDVYYIYATGLPCHDCIRRKDK